MSQKPIVMRAMRYAPRQKLPSAVLSIPECTACGFWDTGLKPTLPERAVKAAADDTQPG